MSLEERQEQIKRELEVVRAVENGQNALEQGGFSEAESYFKEALRKDPDNVAARAGLLETLFRAGLRAEERRKLQDALQHYEGLLSRDPQHHEARVRLTSVKRRLLLRRVVLSITGLAIVLFVLAQLNNFIAWPAQVCDVSGEVLCTPTPTSTATPTLTLTPTPTATFTPTPTPTPTPHLLIGVVNLERTPVAVAEMGVIEDQDRLSLCEGCKQATTAFSADAVLVGGYIQPYEDQVVLDEDALPAPDKVSSPLPDYEQATKAHFVQWKRWSTDDRTASFVVATVTPTPTPMPVNVRGSSPNPNVLDEPGGILLFYLQRGVCVYVCDEAEDHYQVANDYCHVTEPLGWVPKAHLSNPSNGECPPPTPPPTLPPVPSSSPTPTPEG